MTFPTLKSGLLLLLCSWIPASASAPFIDTSSDRVKTPLVVAMKPIGSITPRSTREIKASRITVGCETIDRDLTVWENYQAYLPPLGVKKIRLQAGWAKCEKVPGVYDWKWLDDIIDYAVAHDLEPWLQASYGNPAYEGGGGRGLLNSIMTSPEGYAAWDRWVTALVTRYKDRVTEWEIWNEPDHPGQKITPETTAELNIRTARIIKAVQPNAKIAGLAFASHSNTEYLDRFLKVIADRGSLGLFTWMSYHSYALRPEDSYSESRVPALERVIRKYSPTLKLRQGENGAPSTFIPSFALNDYYWTEYTQAKYNLRRLMGDLGRDIETSVFTIIDIYYKPVLNTKGLIQSDITMAAIRPKVAYYAVQNLAAIFDHDMILNPEFGFQTTETNSLSVFGYQHRSRSANVVALWLDGKVPSNSFQTKQVALSFDNCAFKRPVWCDLMTGKVYELRPSQWKQSGQASSFNIPLYDSPILIAERSFILRK